MSFASVAWIRLKFFRCTQSCDGARRLKTRESFVVVRLSVKLKIFFPSADSACHWWWFLLVTFNFSLSFSHSRFSRHSHFNAKNKKKYALMSIVVWWTFCQLRLFPLMGPTWISCVVWDLILMISNQFERCCASLPITSVITRTWNRKNFTNVVIFPQFVCRGIWMIKLSNSCWVLQHYESWSQRIKIF